MPELPEVETIRRGLAEKIVGVPIKNVSVRLPKIIRGSSADFQDLLLAQNIHQIDRRGKLLILRLSNQTHAVLIHLKMTGQLIYRNQTEQVAGGHPWPDFTGELPNKYSHVVIEFANDSVLYFNDLRQFGYLQVVTREQVDEVIATYGLEPGLPEFTLPAFLKRLEKKRGKLKAVLLDQKILSGLGNIYVDESCFWAGILPTRAVETLTRSEREKLYHAIVTVINSAIEHRGTTVHDFVDSDGKRGNYADFLMVYGRTGKPCLRCGETLGGVIQKIKFAGRGTHFCTECQA
jgi:formamidopyrimidine-DNA glycosylase